MTQLRVMYFDKKEPVACTVALACPSLLHRNSYMQRIFGALEPLQPLAYLTVPDMTTPALTEIIWAAGQPNKLELLRFCFDPCSFRCDGTVPDDMPPPLHAAIMEKSLSASDQEAIIELLLEQGAGIRDIFRGKTAEQRYDEKTRSCGGKTLSQLVADMEPN